MALTPTSPVAKQSGSLRGTNNQDQNPHPHRRAPGPRDPSVPHTEDGWLQAVQSVTVVGDSDGGRDAPEVYQEAGKEVEPEQEKEHYIIYNPDRTQHDHGAAATGNPRKQGEGSSSYRLYLNTGLTASARTSATLTPSATRPSVSSVHSVSTGPSSPTSSPSNAPGTAEKADFKFPSIAITGSGLPRLTKLFLFALHSSNDSATLHIKGSDSSGWRAWGQVSVIISLFKGSSLAAASWTDGDYDQLRLYYLDANAELVELAARCQNEIECDWNGEKSLVRDGASNTTGLTISQWATLPVQPGSSFVSYPCAPGQTIGQDSSLSAIADNNTDTLERLFYTNPDGDFKALRRNVGYAFALTDVWFTNTSYKPALYNLATRLYPSPDLSKSYLTAKQIAEDRSVAEAWKEASGQDWATEASADAVSGAWARADDVGGAIACIGWIDENGQANQHLMYSVGGAMTEYWLHDGTWSHTAIFD
ncbi:uncharacterized protein Z519_02367 [Cladophialophora bantiana CBS 173.52]|uniref:Fucose-specific lectin n=1 Tax=Cladophialophora bantiana (strain ATCC 10958 / CBS 173.52 / CDC B-1940 / NIH 8579) TaxID=1442370 RepID=A0A0D2F452_CLAB1|nr:uncharacterized protein Z519_02367 [Cladophialophora bantiana CBS 173.52]KIW96976.1 hypothetical protein Z519_02367 [Cladophialophora bantiana CBS 173.52]